MTLQISGSKIKFPNDSEQTVAFPNFITVGTNQNIGIGGAASSDTTYKWLTITGPTTSGGGMVQLNNSDASVGINIFCNNLAGYMGTSTAHPFLFRVNSSEVARFDTSGNVGIGTTSPGRRLDIQQASTNYQIRVGDAGANYYDIGRNTGNGLLTFYGNQAVASGYVFSTVNGERARIDTDGNLLLGTTNVLPTRGFSFTPNDSGVSYGRIGHGSGVTSGNPYFEFRYNTTQIGSISQDGTTGVTYNTTSDYRLKENVTPMTTGLVTVAALKPVTYDWISDKSAGEGFIAHELAEVVPLAVTGEKDAVNENGSIKPQGVDYSKIVVHLVAAIQELSAKNDALEARLAALEAK